MEKLVNFIAFKILRKKKLTALQKEKLGGLVFEWCLIALFWLLMSAFIGFLFLVYCSKIGTYPIN